MTYYQRVRHWFRVTFQNACPDPNCTGTMMMYDDRPSRDTCSRCLRNTRQIEQDMRGRD